MQVIPNHMALSAALGLKDKFSEVSIALNDVSSIQERRGHGISKAVVTNIHLKDGSTVASTYNAVVVLNTLLVHGKKEDMQVTSDVFRGGEQTTTTYMNSFPANAIK